jgi:hypothetical protein
MALKQKKQNQTRPVSLLARQDHYQQKGGKEITIASNW